MIKNSRKRITLRQTGALARRMENLKKLNSNDLALARAGDGEGDLAKRIEAKRIICETDIANLQKKGVRVS
jgi:hypothetical protein